MIPIILLLLYIVWELLESFLCIIIKAKNSDNREQNDLGQLSQIGLNIIIITSCMFQYLSLHGGQNYYTCIINL